MRNRELPKKNTSNLESDFFEYEQYKNQIDVQILQQMFVIINTRVIDHIMNLKKKINIVGDMTSFLSLAKRELALFNN